MHGPTRQPTWTHGGLVVTMLLAASGCTGTAGSVADHDGSAAGADASPTSDGSSLATDGMGGAIWQNVGGVVPPPRGLYLGVAERTEGDVSMFEQALGRKAPLLWPGYVQTHSKEGLIDKDFNFEVTEAQRAWEHGYLVTLSFEPHPQNGMRVDDMLRGKHDEHLARVAKQIKAFGKPMFVSVAREPNGVLSEWSGGYGPDGDKDSAWAWKNDRATTDFDPSQFPRPELYRGLGDPKVDDGLERLAAAQRYLYDYLVRREGIDFLSFETMGWVANDGDELPAGQDFIDLHRMISDHSDWISLNWYTDTNDAGARNADEALALSIKRFDAYIQAIRTAEISKPIMINEFGICGKEAHRGTIATGALEALVRDYPEVKGFVLWSVDDMACKVSATVGLPEVRQVVDRYPNRFHSCLHDSDGRPLSTCDPKPSALSPPPEGSDSR